MTLQHELCTQQGCAQAMGVNIQQNAGCTGLLIGVCQYRHFTSLFNDPRQIQSFCVDFP